MARAVVTGTCTTTTPPLGTHEQVEKSNCSPHRRQSRHTYRRRKRSQHCTGTTRSRRLYSPDTRCRRNRSSLRSFPRKCLRTRTYRRHTHSGRPRHGPGTPDRSCSKYRSTLYRLNRAQHWLPCRIPGQPTRLRGPTPPITFTALRLDTDPQPALLPGRQSCFQVTLGLPSFRTSIVARH